MTLLVVLLPFAAMAQLRVVGLVEDENHQPVIGASVAVQGTSQGTITDLDGQFVMDCDAKAVLQVSYVGYKTSEVAVNGRTNIKVELVPDVR